MFRLSTRLALLSLLLLPLLARAMSTAFTYQGRLTQAGAAPTGSFDFQFTLCDAATDGNTTAPLERAGVAVANGLFTVSLDFGLGVFNGDDRWLQIAVRSAGGGSYTPLAPRQPLTPTPYALFARLVHWDGILGRPDGFGVYTAGTGLTLTGQEFAIAPEGVTAGLLASDPASLARVSGGAMYSTGMSAHVSPTPFLTDFAFSVHGDAAFLSLVGPGPDAGATLDQQADGPHSYANDADYGQSFVAGRDGYLARVVVHGVGVSAATLRLYAGDGFAGALLSNQAVTLASGACVLDFEMPVQVASGQTYTFRVTEPDNFALCNINPGSYAGGRMYLGGNPFSARDLQFETWVQDAVPTATILPTLTTRKGAVGIGTQQPADGIRLDVRGTVKMTGFQLGSSATAGQVLTADSAGNGTWTALPASLPPSGTAGGDLSGSYPNPAVAAGAITSSKILDGTIVAADLADGAVTSAKIADGTITAMDVAAGSVTNDKLAANSVTTLKIADNSVTGAKLSTDNAGLARVSGGLATSTGTQLGVGTAAPAAGVLLDVNGKLKATGFQLGSSATAGRVLTADAGGNGNWADLPAFWTQGGNAFGATGVLGTTDDQAMEMMVNNDRALRLEHTASTPNVILGSLQNAVTSGYGAAIGGGGGSSAGQGNTIDGYFCTIAGGIYNVVGGSYSVISGGYQNGVDAGATLNTIGGGYSNVITASANDCTIAGGQNNTVSAGNGAIGGGSTNTVNGAYGTIPGGVSNTAGSYAFAAGYRAKATQSGSFVWADAQSVDMTSPAASTFSVRAANGIWLGTNSSPSIPSGRFLNTSTGGYLSSTGTWTNSCDRNLKTGFTAIAGNDILTALATLPITAWRYKANAGERHLGPTAQDFRAAFGLGLDDVSISTVDGIGVALAAAQALQAKVARLETDNARAQARAARVEAENADLKARLDKLEALVRAMAENR